MGIGCKLDELVRQDVDQRLVSIGQVCKALILNGLGFTQRALYQVSSFFERYPAEQLIGAGVSASMLNDSVLGRVLDSLHEYGTTELFAQLAPGICARLGLEGRFGHMDITSFHLDGQYNADDPPGEDAKVIHLTKGYSRDHRPDLNQVVLNLIVENRAGIPLHMEALSGNSNDSKQFRQTIDTHIDHLNHAYELAYLVMDSAGYTEETITLLGSGQKWISRVPETLGLCKKSVASADPAWQPLAPGYQYELREQTYGGVAQRWLLIHSAQAEARELKTLARSYAKKTQKEYDQVQQLKDQQQTLPNQVGKEVQNPTARWVFQLFAGIHLLSIQSTGQQLVINLKPIHIKIMKLVGSHVQKYYLVPT